LEDTAVLPSHYVGIGASAGGLEAIESFFKHMPIDSDAAFIIVQHLSPDYKSMMTELLSKRTDMPVCRAEEGMLVEANHLYLIPPKYDLRIFHGKLHLKEQERLGDINLPIDIFLSSLAEDQGDKAVGVILSGTGSDGTRGIRAIKENVGMVMVQSEESAAFDGMPRSATATGLVDYLLPPWEMPEQLTSYIKHPYAKKTERSDTILSDEDGLTRIFLLLREKTGIDFTYYKPSTIVRRIERRMTVCHVMDLHDYVRYVEHNSKEIDLLHRDLLIGVTRFFRDTKPFEELADKWLPQLIEGKNERNEPLRIWVAGCSTGEEAYTLAILCQEVMAKLNVMVDVKIFATDVDKEAIVKAGQGLYMESIAADVPRGLLTKYFFRQEDGYQISRRTREMVVFAQHDVNKDPPFTNLDLISCRNLLIYLQSILQRRVLEYFNFSLNNQGILLLGASESTGEMSDYFRSIHHKWKIYQSRGRKQRTALSDPAVTFDGKGHLVRRPNNPALAGSATSMRDEERILDRLLQGISSIYLPFTMVINEEMDLLHVAGDSSPYLKVPTGKMLNKVDKLAHNDLAIPLATGIQRLIKEQKEVVYSNIHLRNVKDKDGVIQMRLTLLPGRKGQDQLIAIYIEEINQEPRKKDPVSTQSYDVGAESGQRIIDLEQELQYTRENLQATVEELETSNEELQATNEELLASNEELQSTNEELQSVNEELYTVNAEFQGKITELTDANNDLDNLLSNTQVATLFLDENLEIRRFTKEVTHFLHIIEHDIGRPFDHFAHDLFDTDLDQLIQQAISSNEILEKEVKDKKNSTYLMRILPYRIAPDCYSGIVLTFVNVDIIKQMRAALEISEERYSMTLKKLDMIAVQLDREAKIMFANDFFIDYCGWRRDELIGRDWMETFIPQHHREQARSDFLSHIEGDGRISPHSAGTILCKNGEERRIWWNTTPLLGGADGAMIGVSSIGEDISDRPDPMNPMDPTDPNACPIKQ
jgi:two-component system, chemotaxis family, CheB/CheR fusion protein